ncbi:MAG: 4-(cytidine 5'-diphospho)-2-C-methyl-D-erythritol kinase [Chloroflexi bacterium]|nr:4-(cytidine 5'-diphospho)-2-C-methyl-D-erythritol kinase [Chloroflexota bacterium]
MSVRNDALTVQAPAKLNLTLEVLGKRRDGYHEIRSVIQTISLSDTLSFQASDRTEFESDLPEWQAEQSLVSQAVSLLREMTGCSRGVTIKVDKRIPLLSGLGGDSSDAAATLRGLNELWGLGLSLETLSRSAARLGSDVPFFLHGGTALLGGRGEVVTLLPPLPRIWVVLVVPAIPRLPGKTKRLYESLKPAHYTDGRFTDKLVDVLRSGREIDLSLLFNTFENVAFDFFAELRTYRDHMLKVGASAVHLVGSGHSLFTLEKERARAEDLWQRLQQQRLECYLLIT